MATGMTKSVTILGSTGSIGESTLDVIRQSQPNMFKVVALTANSRAENLAQQAIEFDADYVALRDPKNQQILKDALSGRDIEIGIGVEAVQHAASLAADFTMAAIVGAAGLEPTLAAVDRGNFIGLANKECIVCGGDLFLDRVKKSGATLLPVDSEHNAIFQVLEKDNQKGVKRLILTASGGPFREWPKDKLDSVTRADALNHPVWEMGAKITIDSATLMNKGLELIEASYLFNRPSSEIDIIIHPQSIIHSMVEYIDGSILAQMGSPDMRTPIAYSLGWPERLSAPVKPLELTEISGLTFFKPDTEKFPALIHARESLEAGGKAPNVLNASNEVAVEAFLKDQISFLNITDVVSQTLDVMSRKNSFGRAHSSVEEIIAIDELSRQTAHDKIKALRNCLE